MERKRAVLFRPGHCEGLDSEGYFEVLLEKRIAKTAITAASEKRPRLNIVGGQFRAAIMR